MPEQKPIQAELQTPFTFSQSSLQDYLDCARRFQLRYIQRIEWPAVESDPVLENERRELEGQQFHRMAQQFFVGLPPEKLARMANTDNLARWWANFIGSFGDEKIPGAARLYPEVTLTASLGKQRITAKFDLIRIENGKATIYDWKTYRKRPADGIVAARPQTRVYRALLVAAGTHLNNGTPLAAGDVTMEYWYADFPTQPGRFGFDEATYKKDWKWLEGLAANIAKKQSYPLTENEKRCAYCQYRSLCERGVRAGRSDEVESELSAGDFDLEQIQEIEF